MSMPPEDVPADVLFKKLLERPAPSDTIDWPGKEKSFKVRIEVLRKKEIDDCRDRVQAWWDAGRGKSMEQQGLLAREIVADRVACEILTLAITKTTPIPGTEERGKIQYPRIFPNADGVRQALFPDEVEVLWQAYNLVQYKFGPWEESVTSAEERNAWVQKLAKGGDASPFLRLPSPQQLIMTASLAAEKLVLSGVLRSLATSLPECWVSALTKLPFDIFSSGWPAVSCTPQGGLQLEWDTIPEPEIPTKDRTYIDVREIASDIVRETRLSTMDPEE